MLVRDPDNEEMNEELEGAQAEHGLGDDSKFEEMEKEQKKVSKEFEMGDKTYDLSKLQGGLTNEEYIALSNKDRGILDRRLRAYANQNAKERHDAIKGNAENILPLDVNSVSKKASSVSESASYEEGAGETVIIKSGSQQEVSSDTESSESITPVVVGAGGGGNDEIGDLLYKGG